MSVNFELYKIFVVVAESGSVNKAAKNLNVTQSAISQSLKSLEGQLSLKLFNRERKGMILTSFGISLYNDIKKKAIKTLEISERKIKNTNHSHKSVSLAGSQIILNKFILNKLKHFKNWDIRLISHLNNDEQIKSVEDDESDFAIIKEYNQHKKNTLIAKKISELNYVFFYNPLITDIENVYSNTILIKDFNSKMSINYGSDITNLVAKFFNKIMVMNDDLIIEYVRNTPSIGYAPKEYLTPEFKTLDFNIVHKIDIYLIYKQNNSFAEEMLKYFI